MKFVIIPADNFIWNQSELMSFLVNNQEKDILLSVNSEGCCLNAIGVYKILDLFKFKSVTILSNNIFESHNTYNIVNAQSYFKFFQIEKEYKEYHVWNNSKLFGALYNRPIWHRIGIASHLYANHRTVSMVNFRANPHDEDSRTLFELQSLFETDPASVENFIQTYKKFPALLKEFDDYTVGATTTQHTDQLCKLYTEFLIDIVAETFTSGKTFFATEKTVRPILLKKPFIIMGPKCFLIHLRQMGFKTFNDYWSEDYDGYEPKQKYKMILESIDNIASKSQQEISSMYADMQEILEHNYNLLINKKFLTKLTYVG